METAKKMLLTIGEMKSRTTCEIGENHVFVEHFGMSPRLVILGGHISLSLVKLGKLLGFHVTVVDSENLQDASSFRKRTACFAAILRRF